jgi:hypothetical protein
MKNKKSTSREVETYGLQVPRLPKEFMYRLRLVAARRKLHIRAFVVEVLEEAMDKVEGITNAKQKR